MCGLPKEHYYYSQKSQSVSQSVTKAAVRCSDRGDRAGQHDNATHCYKEPGDSWMRDWQLLANLASDNYAVLSLFQLAKTLPLAFEFSDLRAQIIRKSRKKTFSPGPKRAPLHLSINEGEAAPTTGSALIYNIVCIIYIFILKF